MELVYKEVWLVWIWFLLIKISNNLNRLTFENPLILICENEIKSMG